MVALAPQFAVLALLCSAALAAPQPRPFPQAHTHHVRSLANGKTVQSYTPEPVFETFGQGVENPLGKRADFRSAGLAFLGSRLGSNKFALKSSSEVDAVSNIYVSQSFNNIPVANAVANVALKGGNVVSWGNSFVKASSKVASPVAKISVEDAITTAEEFFNGKVRSSVAPKLEYYAVDSGVVVLTHVLQLQLDNSIVEAFINAETGEVEGIIDFTANLTLDVIPVTEGSPLDGFQTLVDPEDLLASPEGWDTWNGTRTHVTRGNNVFAFKGTSTSFSSETSPDTYAYEWVPSAQPSVGTNVGKAVTNAFYLINSLHDILYRYGFTESAFNFQQNNFGKGGLGSDAVSISVQDPSGTNNAGMSTLPDGQTSFIQMYRFTVTTPNRDGSLQNDIVTHEFTHGVSSRLTGGGTARCLSTTESRGMGEGWSDSLANFMQQSSGTVQDWATGTYVLNNTAGVRDYIYSTDSTKNPLTYADLRTRTAVHMAGVVWANFNHNILDALIKAHGFAQDALTNPDGDAGNQVYLHLFIDHLAIQPCNPTVVQARAAWIQADINRYDGAHVCLLWKVFASRGLGVNATTTKTNNFDIPAECEIVETSTSETATTTSDAETTTSDVSATSTEVPTTSDVPTATSEETPVETSSA